MSCYAGDEVYISLEKLLKKGLLDELVLDYHPNAERVEYDEIRAFKQKYLKLAYQNFSKDDSYKDFISKYDWVEWYAIYQVFSSVLGTPSWNTWPLDYKEYPKKQSISITRYSDEINYQMFLQYIFYEQWLEIKNIANENGISIFGDIPFYVDIDSVEVWKEPEAFLLDEQSSPTMIAGVPPDYFSETGQKWGNPIYNWNHLKEHHFSFWVKRLQWANFLFDEIRVDHFRAFDTYWAIPAKEETAMYGSWKEAPGYLVLDAIYENIKDINLVAEDLGEIRPEVTLLRDYYHIPGMKVFQFHLNDGFENIDSFILYTGTHDNETLLGWYNGLDEKTKKWIVTILNEKNDEDIHLKIIKFCLKKSKYAIIPIWDILGLDNNARFNIPGIINPNNWTFRLSDISNLENSIKRMNEFRNLLYTVNKEELTNDI